MALQSSGAISLSDIATEFGGSTPHSLSEYYRSGIRVPNSSINSAIPTSGQISFSNFYGTSALRYFITHLGDGFNFLSPVAGLQIDSSNNLYLCGDSNTSGTWRLIKVSGESGIPDWGYTISGGSTENSYNMCLDNQNNIIIVGRWAISGSDRDIMIVKLNSSGTLQWQKRLVSPSNDTPYSVVTDGSRNIYIAGGSQNNTTFITSWYTCKLDENGNILWQKTLGGVSGTSDARGIALDSSNNAYVVGRTDNTGGSGSWDFLIAKYDTNGNLQWQNSIGSTGNDLSLAIAVDSSSNAYVVGRNANDMLIIKVNSSGTLQWQRSCDIGGSTSDIAYDIEVDSTGVYVCGHTDPSSNLEKSIVLKCDFDGNLLWLRSIGMTNDDTAWRIVTNSSINTIYVLSDYVISGVVSGLYLSKLPNDGSLTGTYTNGMNTVVYQSESNTFSTTSYTYNSRSLADSTPSFTTATTTATTASFTPLYNYVYLN